MLRITNSRSVNLGLGGSLVLKEPANSWTLQLHHQVRLFVRGRRGIWGYMVWFGQGGGDCFISGVFPILHMVIKVYRCVHGMNTKATEKMHAPRPLTGLGWAVTIYQTPAMLISIIQHTFPLHPPAATQTEVSPHSPETILKPK